MDEIIVIKVGGSLLLWPDLPRALVAFLDGLRDQRLVLVVGGGTLVDVIRTLDSVHGIGDNRSHQLALHVLDVTARVLAGLVPDLRVVERTDELAGIWMSPEIPVFAPRVFMNTIDRHFPVPLPETWETTSDSIAARVAETIGARRLVLLKSDAPAGPTTRRDAAFRGLVDSVFPQATVGLPSVALVNLRATPPVFRELS